VPELPGCGADGPTYAQALANVEAFAKGVPLPDRVV